MPYLNDLVEDLGELGVIFDRRRIVAATDDLGRIVLVRPDAVNVDEGDDPDAFERALKELERGERPDLARALRETEVRVGGLRQIAVEPCRRTDDGGWSVATIDREVEALRAAGLEASGNVVVLGSQTVRASALGPVHFAGSMMFTSEYIGTPPDVTLATTSAPAPEPPYLADRLDLRGHERPRVLVLDTGIRTVSPTDLTLENPALQESVKLDPATFIALPPPAIDDEDEIDDDEVFSAGHERLDFEAGHGTFVAGIIRQVCPDADIYIGGVLSSFGDGDVLGLLARLETALDNHKEPFDFVVMALGAYMEAGDVGLLERALRRLIPRRTLVVSAAGNQASSRPYYPAALDDVIGVGALGEDGRAWFSNFGGWVDACAPGIDVVSTFFMDWDEKSDQGVAHYRGWARWSGTSFSAPKVVGVLAQEMYLTQCSARTAWTRLSDYRLLRVPDLGTVFNV